MMASEPLDYQEETDNHLVSWRDRAKAVRDIEALMEGTSVGGQSHGTFTFLMNLSKENFPMIERILNFPSTSTSSSLEPEPVFIDQPARALHHIARLVQNLPKEDDYCETTEKLIKIIPASITNTEIVKKMLPESLLSKMYGFLSHCQITKNLFDELNRKNLSIIIEKGRKIPELTENIPQLVYREEVIELAMLVSQ